MFSRQVLALYLLIQRQFVCQYVLVVSVLHGIRDIHCVAGGAIYNISVYATLSVCVSVLRGWRVTRASNGCGCQSATVAARLRLFIFYCPVYVYVHMCVCVRERKCVCVCECALSIKEPIELHFVYFRFSFGDLHCTLSMYFGG